MKAKPERYTVGQILTLVRFYRKTHPTNVLSVERVLLELQQGKVIADDIRFSFIDACVSDRVEYTEEQVGFKASIHTTFVSSNRKWVGYNRFPQYGTTLSTDEPFAQNRLNNGWDIFDRGVADSDHYGGTLYEYRYVVDLLSALDSSLVEDLIIAYQLQKGTV